MCNKKFFLFILLFICSGANAQVEKNFSYYDTTTYQLYNAQQWNTLITIGKQALKNNYDYYYLRMRIGIAYYEKEQYHHAVIHFEKALHFNSSDTLLLEYLYYSYIFAGREKDAKLLSKNFPPSLSKKLLSSRTNTIDAITFGSGTILSNNELNNGEINVNAQQNVYGRQNIINDINYLNIGINTSLGHRATLLQSYYQLNINNTEHIDIPTEKDINQPLPIKQNEYYIHLNYRVAKSFSFISAFHLLRMNYHTNVFSELDDSLQPIFNMEQVNNNEYVYFFGISKDISAFQVDLFTTLSTTLSKKKQIENGLSITTYPLSNLNFYTRSTLFNHFRNESSYLIFSQQIGYKLFPKLWIENNITFGQLNNFNEYYASVVYNTADNITFKSGISVNLFLKHLEIALKYQFYKKTSTYITYLKTNDTIYTETNYQNHLITGGIKWKL